METTSKEVPRWQRVSSGIRNVEYMDTETGAASVHQFPGAVTATVEFVGSRKHKTREFQTTAQAKQWCEELLAEVRS